MRRTISNVDALALRAAVDAHYGYPRLLDASETSGAQQAVWTTTAVAILGDGAMVDVTLADADLALVADSALRARVQSAPRPESDRLPATTAPTPRPAPGCPPSPPSASVRRRPGR